MTGFDTNTALRAVLLFDPLHERCRLAASAVARPCVAEPSLREAYRTVTGSRNGTGLPVEAGLATLAEIRTAFTVLTPTANTMAIWEDLLRRTGARGLKTHDAYLAAVLLSHGVTEIVTLDADFAYPGLAVRRP